MAQSGFPLMFQPLARYADFNGRARRSEYWLWALFLFLLNIFLTIIQYALMFSFAGSMSHAGGASAAFGAGMALSGLVSLLKFAVFMGLIIPSIAVAVRRMHDINRTGWWIVLPNTVFVVALVVVLTINGADLFQRFKQLGGGGNGDTSAAMAAAFGLLGVLTWVLLPTLAAKVVTFIFRVTEGTKGTNRYGPDPKGSIATDIF